MRIKIISTLTDKEIEFAINDGISIDGIDLTDYYTKNEIDAKIDGIDLTDENVIIQSKNLFNLNDITKGYYVRWNEGVLASNVNFVSSNYIEIEANTNYTINYFHQVAFYDINKLFISGVDGYELSNKTITSPINAKYIRVSVMLKDLTNYQLEKGDVASSYEGYDKRLTNNFIDALNRSNSTYKPVGYVFKKIANSLITNEKVTIKLIGDSITHGVGGTGFEQNGEVIFESYKVNENGHCWANSLKDYLESKFNCEVINYGTTGRNSMALLNNINTLVKDNDDVVICMIGTNDRDNGSKKELYENLLAIYNNVSRRGKEIIFMSSIPAKVSNEGSKNFHMEDVDMVVSCVASTLNREYISVYKRFIDYCDTHGKTIDSLLCDEVHPNDEGYDVMFHIICNALGFGTKRDSANW